MLYMFGVYTIASIPGRIEGRKMAWHIHCLRTRHSPWGTRYLSILANSVFGFAKTCRIFIMMSLYDAKRTERLCIVMATFSSFSSALAHALSVLESQISSVYYRWRTAWPCVYRTRAPWFRGLSRACQWCYSNKFQTVLLRNVLLNPPTRKQWITGPLSPRACKGSRLGRQVRVHT